eukprot:TRINITY_DN245_c0_g1_i4.p3 TRINITY_DN245_c0_g1~~TRINITY_DN245_c0_g1_i4.p3  ORF type:complete len:234 (-),score=7.35 TRINITY_DN245_c0_g1_i4:27-728(-)
MVSNLAVGACSARVVISVGCLLPSRGLARWALVNAIFAIVVLAVIRTGVDTDVLCVIGEHVVPFARGAVLVVIALVVGRLPSRGLARWALVNAGVRLVIGVLSIGAGSTFLVRLIHLLLPARGLARWALVNAGVRLVIGVLSIGAGSTFLVRLIHLLLPARGLAGWALVNAVRATQFSPSLYGVSPSQSSRICSSSPRSRETGSSGAASARARQINKQATMRMMDWQNPRTLR